MALGRWSVRWLYQELRPETRRGHAHVVDAPPRGRGAAAARPRRRPVRPHVPQRISIWLVFDRGDVSVCMQHPGYDSDVVVRSTTPALSEVFSGRESWHRALSAGDIEVSGLPRLTRALPTWFAWSPFAPEMRLAAAAGRAP